MQSKVSYLPEFTGGHLSKKLKKKKKGKKKLSNYFCAYLYRIIHPLVALHCFAEPQVNNCCVLPATFATGFVSLIIPQTAPNFQAKVS